MFAEKNYSQIMYEKYENLDLFFEVCCYIAEHSFYKCRPKYKVCPVNQHKLVLQKQRIQRMNNYYFKATMLYCRAIVFQ